MTDEKVTFPTAWVQAVCESTCGKDLSKKETRVLLAELFRILTASQPESEFMLRGYFCFRKKPSHVRTFPRQLKTMATHRLTLSIWNKTCRNFC
eukprot:g44302.t1